MIRDFPKIRKIRENCRLARNTRYTVYSDLFRFFSICKFECVFAVEYLCLVERVCLRKCVCLIKCVRLV